MKKGKEEELLEQETSLESQGCPVNSPAGVGAVLLGGEAGQGTHSPESPHHSFVLNKDEGEDWMSLGGCRKMSAKLARPQRRDGSWQR